MTRLFPIKTSGRRSVPDITRARTAITARTVLTSTPTSSTIIGWSPTSSANKWFQGTCEYPNSCWNQHGRTFDSALRSAFNIQLSSRGRYPPVQFRSEKGGTMRQINRRDAARIIMHTMGDFRRREVRKWRFGTHFTEYHDYEVWDRSIDADRVRSEYRRSQEVARMNDVPRVRSPRTTRRPSPRRASSRPPSASWTSRTVNTPPRGRSSFPPVRETSSSSTTTRPFFELSFAVGKAWQCRLCQKQLIVRAQACPKHMKAPCKREYGRWSGPAGARHTHGVLSGASQVVDHQRRSNFGGRARQFKETQPCLDFGRTSRSRTQATHAAAPKQITTRSSIAPLSAKKRLFGISSTPPLPQFNYILQVPFTRSRVKVAAMVSGQDVPVIGSRSGSPCSASGPHCAT